MCLGVGSRTGSGLGTCGDTDTRDSCGRSGVGTWLAGRDGVSCISLDLGSVTADK